MAGFNQHVTNKKGKEDKMKKLMKYLKEEEGIVAIEYGLIAAGIAVAISAAVLLIGGQLDTLFRSIVTLLGG
jgi:pilus assembly protein Flp/PilA